MIEIRSGKDGKKLGVRWEGETGMPLQRLNVSFISCKFVPEWVEEK